MHDTLNTSWHFPIMMLASFLIFFLIIRMVQSKSEFKNNFPKIFLLAIIVVVIGMLIGKYGITFGLPWWIYYPIPMLMTVLLPPIFLKLSKKRTALYLMLSFMSAPFIHALFSFFLDWHEYMPFWKIPYIKEF